MFEEAQQENIKKRTVPTFNVALGSQTDSLGLHTHVTHSSRLICFVYNDEAVSVLSCFIGTERFCCGFCSQSKL